MYLKNLSKLRRAKGLTQEGLARKANLSYHTIVKLENGGIRNPKIETIIKLSHSLGVSLDDLLLKEV